MPIMLEAVLTVLLQKMLTSNTTSFAIVAKVAEDWVVVCTVV